MLEPCVLLRIVRARGKITIRPTFFTYIPIKTKMLKETYVNSFKSYLKYACVLFELKAIAPNVFLTGLCHCVLLE